MTDILAILAVSAACVVWGMLRVRTNRASCGTCESPCCTDDVVAVDDQSIARRDCGVPG
jgi:hypothetical protein